jgi:hypothetical protein
MNSATQGRAAFCAWGSLGGVPLNPGEWKGAWDEAPSRGLGGSTPTNDAHISRPDPIFIYSSKSARYPLETLSSPHRKGAEYKLLPRPEMYPLELSLLSFPENIFS